MQYFKIPKNDSQIIWTRHVCEKMRQYRLSEGRLRRLLNNYKRREEGITSGTVAIMMPAKTRRPTEIWLMYAPVGAKKKIITAWRYPGVSPRCEVPIPEEELKILT